MLPPALSLSLSLCVSVPPSEWMSTSQLRYSRSLRFSLNRDCSIVFLMQERAGMEEQLRLCSSKTPTYKLRRWWWWWSPQDRNYCDVVSYNKSHKTTKNNNRKSSGTNHTMLHLWESKSKLTNSEHQIQQPHWPEKKKIFMPTHTTLFCWSLKIMLPICHFRRFSENSGKQTRVPY